MDTDDARCPSEEIYHRIWHQAGLSRSGSVGDVPTRPESLGVMAQGRLVLHRRTSDQIQTGHSNTKDQPSGDTVVGGGAAGGDILLNIPPCSMADELGDQSKSLFRPAMSDPELDLEHCQDAKPKKAAPLTI